MMVRPGEKLIPYTLGICQGFDSNSGKCVYFYDQKHIVGSDLKQPQSMHGLCLVSPLNTLTEISQTIFRMRKILYGPGQGHRVSFIYLRQDKDVSCSH